MANLEIRMEMYKAGIKHYELRDEQNTLIQK